MLFVDLAKGEMGGDRGGSGPVRLSSDGEADEGRIMLGVADSALWLKVSNGGSSGGDMRLRISSTFLLLSMTAGVLVGVGLLMVVSGVNMGVDCVLTAEVVWLTMVGEKSRLSLREESMMARGANHGDLYGGETRRRLLQAAPHSAGRQGSDEASLQVGANGLSPR